MIKAVIFDFAGVIVQDAFWTWIKQNVPDLASKEANVHALAAKVDRGDIDEGEFLEGAAQISQRPVAGIKEEAFKLFILNKGLVEIIKKLRKNYKTALLSNFMAKWLDELFTTHDLHDCFDEVIVSSAHRMIKPEPEIFLKMLKMLEVKPEEAVFVDDREVNIAGAQKLGIKTILFKDNAQLVQDLKKLGILI